MNNHETATCLDKAITDLSQLYESCDREMESRVWGILQVVCDAKKNLDSPASQADTDSGIGEILCHCGDIAAQLKTVIDIYHDGLDQERPEVEEFIISSLFAKLAHELYQKIKTVENLT
ncbi:hypothetical protein ACSFCT_09215 [Yokenella regensburgei]|uniref:hypothetical protein n=1 Tax=Yokenella regensburgei TaxID=158877 RepID=UPI003EDA15AB